MTGCMVARICARNPVIIWECRPVDEFQLCIVSRFEEALNYQIPINLQEKGGSIRLNALVPPSRTAFNLERHQLLGIHLDQLTRAEQNVRTLLSYPLELPGRTLFSFLSTPEGTRRNRRNR